LIKTETGIYISDAKKINIGKYCRINENVFLQGEVCIGDYVMIAPNVSIYSTTHIYKNVQEPMVLNGLTECQKVVIKDDVWIGRNSIILPGIKIGRGSIIGANSVVTQNVEDYSVYGGVPARFIKKRK
jgi:acetyltransferase-like isoleucine patch superfamily enzyme